jgi:hypothetical protein
MVAIGEDPRDLAPTVLVEAGEVGGLAGLHHDRHLFTLAVDRSAAAIRGDIQDKGRPRLGLGLGWFDCHGCRSKSSPGQGQDAATGQ